MRPLEIMSAVLALSLLAAPAFADAGHPDKSPAAAKAGKGERGQKREARMVERLTKHGISEAKAKRVVAVVKKFQPELREVQRDVRQSRAALKKDANDAKAKETLAASRSKVKEIRQRIETDLAKFLTPAEQAKVKQVVANGAKHRHEQHQKRAS